MVHGLSNGTMKQTARPKSLINSGDPRSRGLIRKKEKKLNIGVLNTKWETEVRDEDYEENSRGERAVTT